MKQSQLFTKTLKTIPKEESKTILRDLVDLGYILPRRKFGYAINAQKVVELLRNIKWDITRIFRGKYSKEELLGLLRFKILTGGDESEREE